MESKLKNIIKGSEENVELALPIAYLEAEIVDSKKTASARSFVKSKIHGTNMLRVEGFYKPISKL